MHRRRLLALSPTLALMACTPEDSDQTDPASDDGGAPSDGGASDAGGSDGGGSDAGSSDAPATTLPPSAAELLLEQLDEREIAGQLVLAGIAAGTSVDPALNSEHRIGGYFLLQVWESAADVDFAVAAAHEGAREDLPPLISVDQEGGQVRMLRGDAARRTDSAAALGEQGTDAVAEAYTSIGEDLRERGISLDLAPVADVVDPELGEDNAPVGAIDRGFGTEPGVVGEAVAAAVGALDAAEVGATLKHFPGLGRVEENTDFSAEGIEDATTDAEDPFLASFAAGIDAGADAVMLSSAIYPRIEPDVHAMFSSAVVQDLLRDQMGFDGLAVTDDIGAAASVQDIPVGERATRFLAAGGDVVLTAAPELAGELVDAIEAWATEDPAQAQRVRESALRMLRLKERRGLLSPAE